MQNKNVWTTFNKKAGNECEELAASYIKFLTECKSERECVDYFVSDAEEHGYMELSKLIASGKKLKAGDKVYSVCMNKSIVLFQIGKKPMEKGLNILGAHVDSPRMDIKQNPLYEDGGYAYLDTHYYGGIKKYQWVTIPLAIHGVVTLKDQSTTVINIGDNEGDPVFFISDLLPHLAQEQIEKKASKVIEGESLDIIIGSKPYEEGSKDKEAKDKSEKDLVKKNILSILETSLGLSEEDFISAELEVVPAGPAREAGLDRSMIMAYGQDDRVCAYTSYKAMLKVNDVERTTCCILVDKEEIGSVGATGMRSKFFENAVAEVMNLCGQYSELSLRRCLASSDMLSSDVSAAYDPSFASSFDKKNAAYLGNGIVLNKFTGSRGKSGSNDANSEYLGHLRAIFEKEKIHFQTAEFGKVDLGGGGTIAYILALYGMNVIDSGVAVLNMHAPYEVTSKADVYETYRGYMAFLKNADL